MKNIQLLDKEDPAADLEYWMKKTPEERLDAVEFLREQYYAIQGYPDTPRMIRAVTLVEMGE